MKKFFLSFIPLFALGACAPSQPADDGRLQVSTTFYPLTYIAGQVGGELVHVRQITPAGVEPHDYEPSPMELAYVHASDVFLMNGAGLDPWGEAIIGELGAKGVVALRMTDELTLLEGVHEDHDGHDDGDVHAEDAHDQDDHSEHADETQYDPHVWLDPVRAQAIVERVRDAFVKADAQHADAYNANTTRTIAALQKLDQEFAAGLGQCGKRTIVTSHSAFRYLADRYRFETLAIAGLSPEQEPSPGRMAELSDLARDNGIKYIFFETLASPQIADTISREIGAQTLVLNPLEGLTPDDSAEGKDYVSIMKDNLQNLRTAMECQ